MEEGMAHSAGNIVTGKASWQDISGLALLLSPVHKATEETKAPAKDAEPANVGDEAAKDKAAKENEETVKDANVKNDDTAGEVGEKDAYEDGNESNAITPPKSREQGVQESREAYQKAIDSHKQLPKSKQVKTTASDDINTVSGYSPNRLSNKTRESIEVTDVPPSDVMNRAGEIDHPLSENASIDNGVPGQAAASHAEKQIMTAKPGDPIGVSKEMCGDCIEFAQKHANDLGQDVIITDPNGTKIFEPGGSSPIDIGWNPFP